jgi:hypothetical protein
VGAAAYSRTDATRSTGDDDKGHSELTSHRTVGEPTPCQQCRHDRHCSITPHRAATWTQNHDDNHAQTCTNTKIRPPSLQAKIASSLPLGSRPLGRENLSLCMYPGPGLYIRAVRAPFQEDRLSSLHSGSPNPLFNLFLPSCIPHCKNFTFNREIHTQTISEPKRRALT